MRLIDDMFAYVYNLALGIRILNGYPLELASASASDAIWMSLKFALLYIISHTP